MRQAASDRPRAGSLWRGLALAFFAATLCLEASAASREVNLCWTDLGVRPGQRPACLDQAAEALFQPFGNFATPILRKIDPQRGTILIPMPKSEDRPKTDAEWTAFAARLYQGIRDKVQQGLKEGVSSFEIRTVQDLGGPGNQTAAGTETPPALQAQCIRFTEAFLTALDKVTQDLARAEKVHAYGLVGREAAIAAAESLAKLPRPPLDHLIVVDGTATVERAVQASAAMKGRLTLINTAGSILSSPDLVASLKGSQEAQRRDPRIRLLVLEPAGQGPTASVSAASFDPLASPDVKVAVKEFTRKDPQAPAPEMRELPSTTMGDEVGAVLAGTNTVLIPYGVSMGMKVTPDSVKEAKAGELDQLRKEILDSRPPQGRVTSPVPEKGKGD